MEYKKNRVIELNDLVSAFFNADFDGDSMLSLSLHSKQAKRDFAAMFIKNNIEFEHTDKLLIDYEHESIYGAFMLSKKAYENFNPQELIDDFSQMDEEEKNQENIQTVERIYKELDPIFLITMNKLMKYGGRPVMIQGKILSYFEVIINQILDVYKIQSNDSEIYHLYTFEKYGLLNKKGLNKLTYDYNEFLKKNNIGGQFWDRIHKFNKFLLEAGSRLDYACPTFELDDFIVESDEINKFKTKLIQGEPFLAFQQNMVLYEDYITTEVSKKDTSFFNSLFQSGARLKSVQLLKAASNTGIPTDIYGRAMPMNIKNSLLDGLTQDEYFNTGDSARLALGQRQDAIPKGGELQRKFFFTAGILKQNKEVQDCFEHTGKERYFEILIKNEKYLKTLKYRWYKELDGDKELMIQGDENHLIGKKILLRSPITCQMPNYQVCPKCLGEKRPTTANLGAPIGQYLSEATIQSVLRAHHFGGVFLANEDKQVQEVLRRIDVDYSDSEVTILKGSLEDLKLIVNYLEDKYQPEAIDLHLNEEQGMLRIHVIDLPFSEDAVKILNSITGLIDKNRDKKNLVPIEEIYDKLINVSDETDIFNVYFELVLSLIFYDEDDVLYRYSDKPIVKQFALKDVINNIDPKLTIFYNFGNKTIQKIFTSRKNESVDHMYRDLINIYK